MRLLLYGISVYVCDLPLSGISTDVCGVRDESVEHLLLDVDDRSLCFRTFGGRDNVRGTVDCWGGGSLGQDVKTRCGRRPDPTSLTSKINQLKLP